MKITGYIFIVFSKSTRYKKPFVLNKIIKSPTIFIDNSKIYKRSLLLRSVPDNLTDIDLINIIIRYFALKQKIIRV